METVIKIKNERLFSNHFIILGYMGIFISIFVIIYSNILLGLIVLIFSCLLCFSVTGKEIDYERKEIKESFRFIRIEYSNYYNIDEYSKVSIRKIKRIEMRYGPSTNISSTFENLSYEVCLFSENLRKRKMIKRFNNLSDAEFLLNELSEKLNIRIIR
jgi:hypothetical protein